ncbi:Putative RxLR effector [Phytophthora palmivora]|uniref:RxLR effector n=1 Tax=Phytophthora palmivora TaxID=4796 RepID=A0A2P4Y604_9STRA|nr:Putative RxLR effector [Phytophthora palmivora]
MFSYQILLAIMVIVLVGNNIYASAKETKLTLSGITPLASMGTRSLRIESSADDSST